ncbi:holo-ACP synthase [Entomobacter blattae]|uniref:Holo-[acyl-carrier-protein] synthase n=1 Tax=Entomobacter blattae TaxID=2762277 RepID=A0A7H1NSK1_9PROT|nr:holo-ACP synthase [Entomobacter blattae]QNT78761.1 Holo-[acyl-carrier-protein] synthase [Entomobacter blattae]
MILGLGIDLCDIRRIGRVIDVFGERFLNRVFTPQERVTAERRYGQTRINTYAKRWAAKEACAKALGTGFSQNVFHSQIGVVNLLTGQPTLLLTNGAKKRLQLIETQANVLNSVIVLSLTDEYPYAQAQVMIEGYPSSMI